MYHYHYKYKYKYLGQNVSDVGTDFFQEFRSKHVPVGYLRTFVIATFIIASSGEFYQSNVEHEEM